MPEIKLSIGGRDFQVACQEGEENFLTDAANLLNSESQKLVSQLGRLSESRMLLMAGLMLADRMINLEKSIHEREKQIEQKEIDIEKSISAAKAVSDSKPAFANEIAANDPVNPEPIIAIFINTIISFVTKMIQLEILKLTNSSKAGRRRKG